MVLHTRLQEYVRQLHEYIRYGRGENITMLNTWKSLQAYRATVPVGAQALSVELFSLNLGIALANPEPANIRVEASLAARKNPRIIHVPEYRFLQGY